MEAKKIKIIYVITKGNFGGAQRYVFDLATNLPKEHFEVLVAMGEGNALLEKLQNKGIRTVQIPFLQRNINPLKEIASFFYLIKLFKDERPDIVHLNSSKAGGLGGIAGRLTGVPRIIFTGHGWAFNEKRNLFSRILIAGFHWATIALSHTTVAVSKRIIDQISLFPFIKNKLIVIHNGIASINFLNKGSARAILHSETVASIWIGTISELHQNKGIDFIIQAFANIAPQFEHAELFIIGEGEERKKLEALVQKLNVQNKVHFLGFKKDASQYLKAFDIFTLTSRTDAFPYVPLEAGAAGLPVIASRVGGIPELISSKESGILVEPGNIFEIEYALRDLLQNEQKRQAFGKALQIRVERDFTLERTIEDTIKLYTRKKEY